MSGPMATRARLPEAAVWVFGLASAIMILGVSAALPGCAPDALDDDLPDRIDIADPEEKRRHLLDQAQEWMAEVSETFPDDPVVRANCSLASERAAADYANRKAHPLAMAAWLDVNGKRDSFEIHALNVRRETDQIVIAAKTADGRLLRIVDELGRRAKDYSLIAVRAVLVKRVPLAELVEKAEEGPSGELVLVTTHTSPATVLLVPDSVPLAAAVRDRGGALSNFVPVKVVRWKEIPGTGPILFGPAIAPGADAEGKE
jgi:hypothetical protein